MSPSHISVCVALLFVTPCCDCHKTLTQKPSEGVKAVPKIHQFSILHNQNNLQEITEQDFDMTRRCHCCCYPVIIPNISCNHPGACFSDMFCHFPMQPSQQPDPDFLVNTRISCALSSSWGHEMYNCNARQFRGKQREKGSMQLHKYPSDFTSNCLLFFLQI